MKITDRQFYQLFGYAVEEPDRDRFISEASLSDIWGDAPNDPDIPTERVTAMAELWDTAHLSIKDIRTHLGLTQEKFATRFCVPKRSVENWEGGKRSCPHYLRLLLAQAADIYKRDYED